MNLCIPCKNTYHETAENAHSAYAMVLHHCQGRSHPKIEMQSQGVAQTANRQGGPGKSRMKFVASGVF